VTPKRSSSRGLAFVDVVVVCALVAAVFGIAVPALVGVRHRGAPRLAARQLAARVQMLRLEALKRSAAVAVRFDPSRIGLMATYADGDGDGVRQADVDSGIDPALTPEFEWDDVASGVTFQIARDVPSPDASGWLAAGSDPIRLGSTNFLTLSPGGSASSGTLYLAGRGGPQVCVRIFGATGRVRVLWFDPASNAWRQD
jgi:Tfp pilus assembly protein FimT